MADPDTLAQVQDAAGDLGDAEFLELLRWHRAVAGLPDLDWSAGGAYRRGVAELADDRACELLRDVRRVARDQRRHRHGADTAPTASPSSGVDVRSPTASASGSDLPPGAAGAGGWTESTPIGISVVV